ncbi:MAG: hypothetical protein ACHQ5A_00715 [Opitutales bacterium]
MSQSPPVFPSVTKDEQSAPLPQSVQDRLAAEVQLKGRMKVLQRKLEEARQQVARAEAGSPLRLRLLRLLRQPEQDPPVLTALTTARKLSMELAGLTQQGKLLDEELDGMVDYYLYESVAAYREALARVKLLEAADAKAQKIRSTQKDLVSELGSARNMASAGYNKKTGEFSTAAGKLIQKSVAASTQLIQELGALGEELGGSASIDPELARLPGRIAALPKLSLPQMHKEIVEMASVCEKRIPANLEACLGEAGKGAQARMVEVRQYRRNYLATLRRHASTMK